MRELFADPLDEVRLRAHGALERAEKNLMRKIFAARQELERVLEPHARSLANARLAELYWELIYQNLVRGTLYRYTLAQVEHFCRRALSQDQRHAGMWYLLGRCAALNHAPQRAEQCFLRAQALRFPAERLMPWLAEAAFLKREFGRIGPLLDGLGAQPAPPSIQPVLRYWQNGESR
jgi:hypothetical protein